MTLQKRESPCFRDRCLWSGSFFRPSELTGSEGRQPYETWNMDSGRLFAPVHIHYIYLPCTLGLRPPDFPMVKVIDCLFVHHSKGAPCCSTVKVRARPHMHRPAWGHWLCVFPPLGRYIDRWVIRCYRLCNILRRTWLYVHRYRMDLIEYNSGNQACNIAMTSIYI